ncbi:hypothetical protein CP49_33165 [Bradyrhizobium valentinum]|uniref:Uncharacterized protein n=1 Tax=Bradyrhizobium valentinum TaxID=1518501 RepID=A0A0R3KMC4_9BRAD|nr:hypothetical protein CP49_33165 [Bradyrhizobium valentinum]
MTEFPDAGHLFKGEHLPSLSPSRAASFRIMLRMLETSRLRDFHFTVENEAEGSWPVFGWP